MLQNIDVRVWDTQRAIIIPEQIFRRSKINTIYAEFRAIPRHAATSEAPRIPRYSLFYSMISYNVQV